MQRSVGRPSQYCGRGQETVGEALAQTQLRRGKALAEKKSAQSNGIGADLFFLQLKPLRCNLHNRLVPKGTKTCNTKPKVKK